MPVFGKTVGRFSSEATNGRLSRPIFSHLVIHRLPYYPRANFYECLPETLGPRPKSPLFDPQLSLDLLERRTFRLRNHGHDPEKLEHHHAGKERKNVTDWEGGDHLREESSEQSRKDPMRAAAQTLALRAMAIGEYFGDKNPDHRSLADGVRADEGEDASRHN